MSKYLTMGEFAIDPHAVIAVGPPFGADTDGRCAVHLGGGVAFEVDGDQAEVVAALEVALTQPQPEMKAFAKINKAIARRMQLGQAPVEAQEQVLATLRATQTTTESETPS